MFLLCYSQIQRFWCHRLGRGHVGVNIQITAEEMLDGLSCLLEMSLQALWDMWVCNINIYKIIFNKCQMSCFDSTLKCVKIQYSVEVIMRFHILSFNKNDAQRMKRQTTKLEKISVKLISDKGFKICHKL